MFSPKVRIVLYLIGQILAQGAVVAIVPAVAAPYFAALLAVIGVLVAFSDTSVARFNAIQGNNLVGSSPSFKKWWQI